MAMVARNSSPRRRPALIGLSLLVVALGGCGSDDESETSSDAGTTSQAETTTSQEATATEASVPADQLEPADVTTELEVPWGIDFLPNGDALVTERDSGRLLRIDDSGKASEVQVIDSEPAGEGGLLGIAVSPDYATDKLVYAYYSTAEDNRISRFELGEEPEPIVTGIETAEIHNGGGLAFGPDGMLYASTGDAGDGERAQDRESLNGKILRMTPEGDAPSDNPFGDSLVYSRGHRNVEGLAWDEQGELYATEFGESEFDEVNLIKPGANYGWPMVEGDGGDDGFVDPILTWSPSEASPAGAVIPDEEAENAGSLAGTILVAALAGERLWQVELSEDGEEVTGRTPLLEGELGRIRTAVQTPDGEIWLATSNRDGRGTPNDGDDRIVRLKP